MRRTLRQFHWYAGWLLILAFVLTGQYMRYVIHPAMEASDRLRFSLRGNHIYILLIGLQHLFTGAYFRPCSEPMRLWLQRFASALQFVAATLILTAFFFESKAGVDRPLTLIAMIAAVAGTGLHLLAVRGKPE
jgi:hypothetical protein